MTTLIPIKDPVAPGLSLHARDEIVERGDLADCWAAVVDDFVDARAVVFGLLEGKHVDLLVEPCCFDREKSGLLPSGYVR